MVVNKVEYHTIKELCLESFQEFDFERAYAAIHALWVYDITKGEIITDEPTIESMQQTAKELLQGVAYDLCYLPIDDDFYSCKKFARFRCSGQRHIPRLLKRGTDNKSSFCIELGIEFENREIEMCEDEGVLKMIEKGEL